MHDLRKKIIQNYGFIWKKISSIYSAHNNRFLFMFIGPILIIKTIKTAKMWVVHDFRYFCWFLISRVVCSVTLNCKENLVWTCEIVTIYLVNSPKKRSPRFQWSFPSVFLNHQLFIAREKMKGIDYEQYGSSCRMTSKFSQRIRSQPLISIIKSHNVNNNVSTFALFNRKYFYISTKSLWS